MTTKLTTSNFEPNALGAITGPRIANVQVTDSTYTVLDDTAVDVAGGYIKITGTNFVTGCQVMVDMTVVSTVTFVSATEVRAQLAARAAGTYTVYVINPNGDTAVRIYGVTFSAVPAWVTGSTLTGDSGTAVSIQLAATDASTYSLAAGSTLPPGLTLSSAGLISGTVTVATETLYNFTVVATDAELQDSPRSFAITVTVGDQQIANVTTLLSPEASVLPFNDDASANNFAVSVAGDTRPNNFGPYTPGYYSNFFDGTGDSLSLPTTGDIFNFGTGDFTVEAFVNLASTSEQYVVGTYDGGNGGWAMYLSPTGSTLSFRNGDGSVVSRTFSFAVGSWYHIAVSRSSSTLRFFVNGTQVGADQTSYTQNITRNNTNGCAVGRYMLSDNQNGGYVNGYISNLRVVKGTAVYTASFTSPAAPLTAISGTSILTCQSNRFIDNSTNAVTVTRNGDVRIDGFDPFVIPAEFLGHGSTYFDGTGDYLTVPDNTSFDFTGDFTMEAWVYPNAISANNGIVSQWSSGLNFIFKIVTSGRPYFAAYPGSTVVTQGTTTAVVVNTWNHIAVTRSGSTIRLFVNGILDTTTGTVSGTISGGNPVTIGSVGTAEYLNGYISNLRLIKGTALYTTAFTPPTAPLTAVTNTSLLTCQTNQPANNNVFLDSSTNNFLITRNGNTTQGTFSPYGGGWSNYFDGTGDHLTVPFGTQFAFPGDFTIEGYIYISALPTTGSQKWIVASWDAGANKRSFYVILSESSGYRLIIGLSSDGTSASAVATNIAWSNPQLNTWYHFAAVRSGTTITGYINGTSIGSGTNSVSSYSLGSAVSIGTDAPGLTAAFYWNGYISNIRIVKGSAVYTSNFTPPTAPLEPIAGTSLLTCADNRFVDDSPNNFIITRNGDVRVEKFNPFGIQTAATPASHSVLFDGTGDYLTITSNAAFAYGTGNFTIESWIYVPSVAAASQGIVDNRATSSSATGFYFGLASATIQIYSQGVINLTGGTIVPLTWTHVAVTREGSTIRLFVNGVQVNTTTNSTNWTDNALLIGAAVPVVTPITGYISNLRIVKGTAVYTAAFTPATAPLTAVANTSLLTCQSAALVDNSTNRFTITAAGDARPSQTNPFGFTAGAKTSYTPAVFGGSTFFDGTGDYLTVAGNSTLALGAGDFTVEGWFYATTATGWRALVLIGNSADNGLYINSSNELTWYESGNRALSAVVTANQWNHFAVTRSGSTLRVFLNGVKSASDYATVGNYTRTSVNIGANGSAGELFTGYLSNIRVVKGQALYTSNFAPPIAPLTPIINATLLLNGTSAAVYDASMNNNLETVADARISTAVVKYGNTSMFFDGTGDSLTLSNTVSIGTGDFTIEGWFWLGAIGDAYYNLFNSGIFGIRYGNNGFANRLQFSYDLNTLSSIYSCVIQSGNNQNQWKHIAWTRSGGVNRLFFDGVQQNLGTGVNPATYPVSSFTNSTSPPAGGIIGSGWLGYIQDFRITRGVARYTATFTPPAVAFKTK